MRLVSYRVDTDRAPQAGLLLEDTVVPVVGLMRVARNDLGIPVPPQLAGMRGVPMELVLSFWQHAEPALHGAAEHLAGDPGSARDSGLALDDAILTSPVTDPPSFRDFYAFEEHVARSWKRRGQEIPEPWFEVPVFYFSHPGVLHGPGQQVTHPATTQMLDFELECAWIIGQRCSNLDPEEAWEAIVGLTVLNDWSARDVQAHEMQVGLGPSKGKDFATSLGPAIVTLDELEDHREGDRLDLAMTAQVNGEQVSQGTLSDLHWTIAEMTAHASRDSVLQPGDVLGTGTVGTGSILDLGNDAWLTPGDVVTLEIEGLGVLENQVVGPGS